MNKTFTKAATIATATAAALAPLAYGLPTQAAGVVITAAPTDIAVTTATDVNLTWTSSVGVEALGTVYTLTVSPDPGAVLADCTVADLFAEDDDTNGAGAFSGFTNTNATFTTTSATVLAGRDLCVKFPSAAQGSYSIAISSSASGDYGAALVYVGDDNDVNVLANVAPTLSFNIRTLADDGELNVCDLGTVDTTTTAPNGDIVDNGAGECGYGLAIGTNAQGGFQAQINADGALNTAGGDAMADFIEDTSTFTAGTEIYGLDNVTAAQTGRNVATGLYDQTITEDGNYTDDGTPVPTSAENIVSYTDGIAYVAGTDATDLTLVMHGLTVGSGTPAGSYDQLVTYTVTATF